MAIWFKAGLDLNVEDCFTDPEGRFILLKAVIYSRKILFANCYAPDNESDQAVFFEEFNSALVTFCDDNNSEYFLMLGGDFNVAFDVLLDKHGGSSKLKEKSIAKLRNIMDIFDLIDIWRIRNPTLRKFTWKQRKPPIQCRLDFWLISDSLQETVKDCDIIPAVFTDHSAINIELDFPNAQINGPGYWKLNTALLQDSEYRQMIKDGIKAWQEEFSLFQHDKRKLWEAIKYRIRQHSITYSKAKARKARKELEILEEKHRRLEDLVSKCPTSENFDNLVSVKNEIEKYYNNIVKGHIIRSRTQWYEEGEKNTRFFLNLEKNNISKSNITCLIPPGGENPISDRKVILTELRSFYEKLYTSKGSMDKDTAEKFLYERSLNKLSEEFKDACDRAITNQECKSILECFSLNKSPGNDGLPIEFYKIFWESVGGLVLDSFNDAFTKGELSHSQKQGVIKLIDPMHVTLLMLIQKYFLRYSLND